jgi:hypothetical protein
MRIGSYIVGAVVAGVLLVTGSAGAVRSVEPLPVLSGVPLSGPTHLRLIVSGAPPYILDLDSGTIRPVAGVTDTHTDGIWVMPVHGGALAATYRYCKGCNTQMRASILGANGSVRPVGAGRSVVASRNSAAALVLNRNSAGRCTIRLVPGDGGAVGTPCGTLAADSDAGPLMWTNGRMLLVDRHTGRVRARRTGETGTIAPLYGSLVLEQAADHDVATALVLMDVATGERRRLRWPSILGGLDQVLPQAHGSLVAVGFADPAYPGPQQAEDVFLLDTHTWRFTHVPGFPAQEDLKFSSMAWTSDNRLVMLIHAEDTTRIGVYHPGDAAVALRAVDVPATTGGSDSFVPIMSG